MTGKIDLGGRKRSLFQLIVEGEELRLIHIVLVCQIGVPPISAITQTARRRMAILRVQKSCIRAV